MSPKDRAYFDYPASQTNLRRVFGWGPSPLWLPQRSAARVIGGELCVWSEHVPAEQLWSWLFPRLYAGAERLWSPMPTVPAVSRSERCGGGECG